LKRSADGVAGLPEPLPNYGKGALYCIGSALLSGIAWGILSEFAGQYNLIIALAVGWIVGSAVKRGMGVVDRVGQWISLYGTLIGVLLGSLIFVGMRIHEHGGSITAAKVFGSFFLAFKNLKFLAIYLAFTGAACWVAVSTAGEGLLNSLRRGKKKKKKEEPAEPEP
jgi:hypothetical protein